MKRVLHVGCGQEILGSKKEFNHEEYIEVRLDIDPTCNPDICCSVTDIAMHCEADSFDIVYSSHNIEHLFPHEVTVALRMFLHVLKPGGKLILHCPDILQVAEDIVNGKLLTTVYVAPSGPVAPIDMLYGYTDWLTAKPYMAHRTGFTADSMLGYLEFTGYKNIICEADGKYSLWATAEK